MLDREAPALKVIKNGQDAYVVSTSTLERGACGSNHALSLPCTLHEACMSWCASLHRPMRMSLRVSLCMLLCMFADDIVHVAAHVHMSTCTPRRVDEHSPARFVSSYFLVIV